MTVAAEELAAFLAAQERKSSLRFLTCGSVDDGKSTLIGRLLYDSHLLNDDHLRALETDSKKHGTAGGDIDFALLVDGLEAEREQGITIDVAYRFFSTDKRKFIVADTPGHEQYTRNMATGAANSELAVLLVDARKGMLAQTRRHAYIASLLGLKHVIVAVNKIDLVEYSQGVFERIVTEFRAFAAPLGFTTSEAVPLSARFGDNVYAPSENTPWYLGPPLMALLESVNVEAEPAAAPFRLPVQWVNRPNLDFRGFSGTISAGRVAPGDDLVVAKSGRASKVRRIVTQDGDLEEAVAGQAVTLVLADEVDVSSGDLLVAPTSRPEVSDQLAAHILWMSEDELAPGREYLLKCGARTVPAQITSIQHQVDVNTLRQLDAKTLRLNEVGSTHVSLAQPIAFDAYRDHRDTGGFILIDRFTNQTVAAGMIDSSLRRASNIVFHPFEVDQDRRAAMKGQKSVALWFTGLPSAGKSTIANLVERALAAQGRHTYLLDGDNVRHGLNRDLGFTDTDRIENIRRVAEATKLFVDAGLIVLVSLISPFNAERQLARRLLREGQFVEIFVDTPLEECIRRDPKGLYGKAQAGELKHFTGIDSPYEPPLSPELTLKTVATDATTLASEVVRYLEARGYVR